MGAEIKSVYQEWDRKSPVKTTDWLWYGSLSMKVSEWLKVVRFDHGDMETGGWKTMLFFENGNSVKLFHKDPKLTNFSDSCDDFVAFLTAIQNCVVQNRPQNILE